MAANATARTKSRVERTAALYDRLTAVFEPWLLPGRRTVWSRVRGRVLEVGVGTGRNFPFYPRDAQVVAIDFSPRILKRAQVRARELGTRVQLEEGDVQALRFADASFDMAVTTCVFCSVPDPVRGLKELGRVVKPGGQILLLEHVRVDQPIVARVQDLINPFFVRLWGSNFNRRTVQNVRQARLPIKSVEHLDGMGMLKLITACPNGAA